MPVAKQEKIKLLLYGDSPVATSGLGRLHRYLLKSLHATGRFEITVLGLNHHYAIINSQGIKADYDRKKYPYEIISPYMTQDTMGVGFMKQLLATRKFDLVITSHDIQNIAPFMEDILKSKQLNGTKWINYIPIDRMHILQGEIGLFSAADYLVMLSDYGKNKILEKAPELKNITRIYHPIDLKEWELKGRREKREFSSKYFQRWKPKDFIIGNVNRNIFRKDLVRTMVVFKKFVDKYSDAKLYMHCKVDDEGGHLGAPLLETGLTLEQVGFPNIKDISNARPQEELNMIYQSIKAMITTSLGEGFGYSTVEAFATKVPVIAPNNTTFTELIGENQERGYLAKCSDWTVSYGISNVMRAVTDVDDMVRLLEHVYNNYDEAMDKAEKAYDWVSTELNPIYIRDQWLKVIDQVLQS